MVSYDNADTGFRLATMNYWQPDAYLRYFEEYMGVDPWLVAANALGEEVSGRAFRFDEIMPPGQFVQTSLYNDLFRPLGDDTGRLLGYLPPRGPDALTMGVHRALTDAPFTPLDAARLDEVHGHTRRVLHLRTLLNSERRENRRMQVMLDASDRAMLLVDKRMAILRASAEAISSLDLRDGLSCRQGRFYIDSRTLDSDVRAAVHATIDRLPVIRSAFLCIRPSGRSAFRLLVLPAGLQGDAGALIVIDDVERRHDDGDRLRWLREAYNLTTAETKLAEGLLMGETLDEIAARRMVSRETIRTQLKALFSKTGTKRQTDLVRLLGQMPALTKR